MNEYTLQLSDGRIVMLVVCEAPHAVTVGLMIHGTVCERI